jgi:hypothetical protein
MGLGNEKPKVLMEVEKVIWKVVFSLTEGTVDPANALTALSEAVPWDSVQGCSLTDRAWFDVTPTSNFPTLPNRIHQDRGALPSEELSADNAESRPNLQLPQASNTILETNPFSSSIIRVDDVMEVDDAQTGYASVSQASGDEAGSGLGTMSMAGTQDTTDSPHLVAPSSFGHADVGHDEDETESRKGDLDSGRPLNKKRPSPIKKRTSRKNRLQSVTQRSGNTTPTADSGVKNQNRRKSNLGTSRRAQRQFHIARDGKISQENDSEEHAPESEEDDSDRSSPVVESVLLK